MKINGVKFEARNEKVIPILRNTSNVYFLAYALDSMDEFEELCPLPKPKTKGGKPGEAHKPIEDDEYRKELAAHNTKWVDWITIRSVTHMVTVEKEEQDDGTVKEVQVKHPIEWDNVILEDPSTWRNLQAELAAAGFSLGEIGHIRNGAMEAQGLSEAMVGSAIQDFLAREVVDASEFYSAGGLSSTPSGGAVKDSASSRPA